MGETKQALTILLSSAAILSGAEAKTKQSLDVATVLKTRLKNMYEILQERENQDIQNMDINTLQYFTAMESLRVIEKMQDVLDPEGVDNLDSPSEPPLLGTRDLSNVRILLSIVFRWGMVPLLSELDLNRPGQQPPAPTPEPHIIDLTDRHIRYEDLPGVLLRVLKLIFGKTGTTRIRQSWITSSLLSQHAVDLLSPCLVIGWSPRPVNESFAESGKEIKALSIRFINLLRPDEAITALATILSSSAPKRGIYLYVPRICSLLLSRQLGRSEGVRGLCIAVFGDELNETESAPLNKLEDVSKVLSTVPASITPENYFRSVIPRMLEVLLPFSAERTPSSHKRAVSFALSRMLSSNFQHKTIVSNTLFPTLHKPFLLSTLAMSREIGSPSKSLILSPLEALQTLQTFLLYTDPSPTALSALLSPISAELYTILSLYQSSKVADPTIRESLIVLWNTWGRVVSSEDIIDSLWDTVLGRGGNWQINLEGFARSENALDPASISLLTAAELEAKPKDEVDINANPFSLRPDPLLFVTHLKTLNRADVSSEIFVRLLNGYRELKDTPDQPLRPLLFLQLILQMQDQLSTSVLSKPEHILSFVKHALSSVPQSASPTSTFMAKKGLSLSDLRIVDTEEDVESDSDDEEDDMAMLDEATQYGKDGIIVTSISLLLSILEGHPDLTANNAPDLHDIMSSLDNLISHTSATPTVRQLAREARLVLTARSASTSSAVTSGSRAKSAKSSTDSTQATYQRALKLLQDPIIPVRAHGLQLLRELVARPGAGSRSGEDVLDAALIPGILSIFLQSIQDEESYIFLNAVQGLAAMVDGYGKGVFKGVMDVYLMGTGVGGSGVAGMGGSDMKREELDARIRVGEAVSVVVKRSGEALGGYVDILIPPLLTILRSSHLPTTLRTSALSILAECAMTNVIALHAYVVTLAEICIDILQLETVAATPSPRPPKEGPDQTKMQSKERPPQAESDSSSKPAPVYYKPPSLPRGPDLTDKNPTTVDSKAAAFRRSALYLLAQLFRAHIQLTYDEQGRLVSKAMDSGTTVSIKMNSPGNIQETVFPEAAIRKLKVILGYIAVTDEDGLTKYMAQEGKELVEQYERARLAGL